MKDFFIILSVTNGGETLNHKPLIQYLRIRYAIGKSNINQLTLTMPIKDRAGVVHPKAQSEMNVQSFYNGNGFSNADIKRWLEHKHWTRTGTLLLFKVSFRNNVLNYTLVGKVDTSF